jgi:purine catabolism regulator
MYRSLTTVEDVFRLAMPANTKLLTGNGSLARPVSWACSLRPSPPAFPKLDGNELALIDMADLHRLDPQLGLERVVRSLQDARVSAIGVVGSVSDDALRAARTSRLALFELPPDVPLVQVERTVIRLIVDREGYLAQRAAELQRTLNHAALDGGGYGNIAEHVHRFSQQPVLILREDGKPYGIAGLDEMPETRLQALMLAVPNTMSLRSWAASGGPGTGRGRVTVVPLAPTRRSLPYREAVLVAIIADEAVRGFCLLLRASGTAGHEVTAVEEIAVAQAAAAAGLEWAKKHAVDLAQERMRATFLDELLASEIADEQAWVQRGASLHYDLTRPHAALIVEALHVPDWPAPLLRFLEEKSVVVPYSQRDQAVLVFWPTESARSARELKSLAYELAEYLMRTSACAQVIIGIGRPAARPGKWLQSQQQARESWRMGSEWTEGSVTYFGDLGLYKVLTALGENGEARRLFHRSLGRLLKHDEQHNGELVKTLGEFFACHGNLTQTARRLQVHRNTLSYRLARIADITQLDLDDPDARFALQLALKLQPVVDERQDD